MELKLSKIADGALQLKASPLELSTLTSLLNYIASNTDTLPGHMLLHIKSPTEVQLMSELDADRKREVLATVNAGVLGFENEIPQPVSRGAFMIKAAGHGQLMALYDAYGITWEMAATLAISEYLTIALQKMGYSISAHTKSWEQVEILAPTIL